MDNHYSHDDFHIIVAGTSGSGKTVFLASMYDHLSSLRPDIGFLINEGGEYSSLLVNAQARLRRGTWPKPTAKEEWSKIEFTLKVPSGKNFHEACTFTYYDYSGELLTQRRSEEGVAAGHAFEALQSAISRAHCVLGLIDGEKLLNAVLLRRNDGSLSEKMMKRAEDDTFNLVDIDIPVILNAVNSNKGKPAVHFVISKWDLLESAGVSLAEAKEFLLSEEKFKLFCDSPLSNKVRLIPVSAVGRDFARLEPGIMRILLNAKPKAFQVEMPLACVFPDRLQILQMEIEKQLAEAENISIRVAERAGFLWWKRVFEALGRAAARILPPRILQGRGVQRVLQLMTQPAAKSREEAAARIAELEREKQSIIGEIQTRDDAFQAAVLSFQKLTMLLHERFPEAELDKVEGV